MICLLSLYSDLTLYEIFLYWRNRILNKYDNKYDELIFLSLYPIWRNLIHSWGYVVTHSNIILALETVLNSVVLKSNGKLDSVYHRKWICETNSFTVLLCIRKTLEGHFEKACKESKTALPKQLETIGHQMPGVTVNKLDTGEQ